MVSLVIEQISARHVRRLYVVSALIIRVGERPASKRRIDCRQRSLNARVFPHSCAPESGKIVI